MNNLPDDSLAAGDGSDGKSNPSNPSNPPLRSERTIRQRVTMYLVLLLALLPCLILWAAPRGQVSRTHLKNRILLASNFPTATATLEGDIIDTPTAPSGLTATPGDTQVLLHWNTSTGIGAATTYTVRRSMTHGGPYTDITSDVTDNSFADTGLTNGTTYYYVVRANNAHGSSADSNQASATPVDPPQPPRTPRDLTAIAGNAQVTLFWTASTGATGYTVRRSTTSGGPYTNITPSVTNTTFTNTGLTNGTTYYYVVRASNADGNSANSNQASATPQATTPTGHPQVPQGGINTFIVTGGAETQTTCPAEIVNPAGVVIATFSSPGGGTSNGWTFSMTDPVIIPGGPDGPPSYGTPVYTVGAPTSATIAAGYRVRTVAWQYPAGSAVFDVVAGNAPPQPPATPTGLSATPGRAQITLSWTASTGATSYMLGRSTIDGGPYENISPSVSSTSYNDTGLTSGTTYYYVVRASNVNGDSANSAQVSATTLTPTATPTPTATVTPTATPMATPSPMDARISGSSGTDWVGQGIINATGDGQGKEQVIKPNTKASYSIKATPTGDSTLSYPMRVKILHWDNFSQDGWTAQLICSEYRGASLDITSSAISSEGWVTWVTSIGTSLRLEVTPPATALEGTTRSLFVQVDQPTGNPPADVVVASTQVLTPRNNRPIAQAQTVSITAWGPSRSIILSAVDPDNDAILGYRIVSKPKYGTLTMHTNYYADGRHVIYIPESTDKGSDSFVFVAFDQEGEGKPAVVSLDVQPITSTSTPIPTATPDACGVSRSATPTSVTPSNPYDPNHNRRTETYTINNLPTHTQLSVSFTLHLTPSTWDGSGFAGPDSFSANADGTILVDDTFTSPTVGIGHQPQTFQGPKSHTHVITRTISHTSSSVTLTFVGHPNQEPQDEDWYVSGVQAQVECPNALPRFLLDWDGGKKPVSVGNKSTTAHQATYILTITDLYGNPKPGHLAPPVEVLRGGRGSTDSPLSGVATCAWNGTYPDGTPNPGHLTDANGQIRGTFTSGKRTENTVIGPRQVPGDTNSRPWTYIDVDQVWSSLTGSAAWDFNPYFRFNTTTSAGLKLSYPRGGVATEIDGHAVEAQTDTLYGYEWNPALGENGDYEEKTYSKDDTDLTKFHHYTRGQSSQGDLAPPLVEWGPMTSSGGKYSADQTIHWSDDYILDWIYFWYYDNDSYGPKGDIAPNPQ